MDIDTSAQHDPTTDLEKVYKENVGEEPKKANIFDFNELKNGPASAEEEKPVDPMAEIQATAEENIRNHEKMN
ncbi:hypothetical protein NQU59_11620 [Acinetobacter colistiniresistens]|uniref:hypothetical protein n=1 Tax=Acinetobacter colistiniresistens TaxID=280145 RepID=UPI00211B7B37|nr:hypothetical protein [Acinetobacter colistiniresistens]UUM26349.1 hypothetical protein NQU59_11620 [Acinetobacter colistiniresistens]